MDFMTCHWEEAHIAKVIIDVKKFPDPAITLEDVFVVNTVLT